ncbi:MAG TPA: CARDB domain-containing protein [Candidatus Thermoplasmatota archaeon]|jgi:DNA-binding MarR family transcriptional regulator|nr:CARDB domain-containing protein [Candidatus Thermoplasmatota archaeon]
MAAPVRAGGVAVVLALLAAGLASALADDRPPDVALAQLFLEPRRVVVDDRLWTVGEGLNLGDATLPSDRALVRILVDGQEIANGTNRYALGPGERWPVEAVWRARVPGPVHVEARVEAEGKVLDALVQDLLVEPVGLPDLRVRFVGWEPGPPEPGLVRFIANIANNGPRNADEFLVRFLLDGKLLKGDVASGGYSNPATFRSSDFYLHGGSEATFRSPQWFWDGAPHRVEVVADSTGVVREGNEANNRLVVSFPDGEILAGAPPKPRPDFAVDRLRVAPDPPLAGVRGHVAVVVRNVGEGAAGGRVELVIDGAVALAADVSDLPAGHRRSFDVAWTPTPGTHRIEARVAPGDRRDASAENDRTARTVEAAGQANIVLQELQPPDRASAGQPARLQAEVANRGTAHTGPLALSFMVDGAVVAVVQVPDLAPGAHRLVETDAWSPAPGIHVVEVRAAPMGGLREPSTADNAMRTAVTVDAGATALATVSPVPLAGDHATAATGATILAGFAALYHRIHASEALSLPTRRRVYARIRADPGCTVGAVARATGLSYKSVQRHVHTLERGGLVAAVPGPQQRLFVVGLMPASAQRAAVVLRTPSAQRVWARLAQGPARVRELARELELAPSTVAEQARRLEASGLAARTADGKFIVLRDAAG